MPLAILQYFCSGRKFLPEQKRSSGSATPAIGYDLVRDAIATPGIRSKAIIALSNSNRPTTQPQQIPSRNTSTGTKTINDHHRAPETATHAILLSSGNSDEAIQGRDSRKNIHFHEHIFIGDLSRLYANYVYSTPFGIWIKTDFKNCMQIARNIRRKTVNLQCFK